MPETSEIEINVPALPSAISFGGYDVTDYTDWQSCLGINCIAANVTLLPIQYGYKIRFYSVRLE